MTPNFGAWLLDRLGPRVELIDAAGGDVLNGVEPIRRTSAAFRAHGIAEGTALAIVSDVSPASAVAYLAALSAGIVALPVDHQRGRVHIAAIAERVGLAAVWAASPKLLSAVAPRGLPQFTGIPPTRFGPVPSRPGRVDRLPADVASLMPTSGSTGVPRLVAVAHRNLIANTSDIVATQHLEGSDRALLALPLSYCFGASVLHSHLAAGGDVVFDRRLVFPDAVLDAVEDYRCTTFAGVPAVYKRLLAGSSLSTYPVAWLRRWLIAGGRLEKDDIRRLRTLTPHVDVYVMYGQTEATARITCLQPNDLDGKLGSVGRPLPSVSVRIDDVTGEVLVGGPSVTLGYWNDAEGTAARFRDDWLRTGDLGHLDADGFLWIDGRQSDFVKVAGVRLSLLEVETEVRGMPGVADAAAVALPEPSLENVLVIFVVPEIPGCSEDLARSVRARVPRRWAVAAVKPTPALPHTANGKLSRTALATLAGSAPTPSRPSMGGSGR